MKNYAVIYRTGESINKKIMLGFIERRKVLMKIYAVVIA